MTTPRTNRDVAVFLSGIMLGILGNLVVENGLAWGYPEGIPHACAQNCGEGIYVLTVECFKSED